MLDVEAHMSLRAPLSDAKTHRARATPPPRQNETDALTRNSDVELLPADLAAFVLFFEPAHQRFEVFHHRASGDVFAGSFLQNFAPIFGAAFFQNIV